MIEDIWQQQALFLETKTKVKPKLTDSKLRVSLSSVKVLPQINLTQ